LFVRLSHFAAGAAKAAPAGTSAIVNAAAVAIATALARLESGADGYIVFLPLWAPSMLTPDIARA
jgi:hypothetical protein